MEKRPNISPQSAAAALGQFRNGLNQQLYYLGMDVMHPSGNLLIKSGFEKKPSPLLRGTSCYHKTQSDGSRIELHGSSISWVSKEATGIVYLRGLRSVRLWNSGDPFIPGDYENPSLIKASASQLFDRSKNIVRWWLSYEREIRASFAPSYRRQG